MPSSSLRRVLDEISAHVQALRAHEAGARAGRDPEHLHEMRVAVRRLRAILRASRALFDATWVDRLRDELDWLGGGLGLVRDLDVLHAYLRPRLAALEGAEHRAGQRVLRRLSADRTRARADLNRALDSARYPRILEQLETFLSRPPASAVGRLPARRRRDRVEAAPQGGPEAARAPERGRAPRGPHQGQARALRGRAGARRRGRARQALHPPGQEAARHPWRSAGRCGNRTVSARCHRSHGARAGPRPGPRQAAAQAPEESPRRLLRGVAEARAPGPRGVDRLTVAREAAAHPARPRGPQRVGRHS